MTYFTSVTITTYLSVCLSGRITVLIVLIAIEGKTNDYNLGYS